MPKLVVLYPPPVDVVEFERVYAAEHIPLVRAQMPGVTRFEAARVIRADRAAGMVHWMAELHFASMDALVAATSSDGGQRAAGHARQISTGGAPTTLVVDDPR